LTKRRLRLQECARLPIHTADTGREILDTERLPRADETVTMSAQEATINPDGSTTFETPPTAEPANQTFTEPEITKPGGLDPAWYVLLGLATLLALYYIWSMRKSSDKDDFFSNLDIEKVSEHWIVLPMTGRD
jgi:hypothetical protein